jgi:hypothetical protein
MPLRDITFRDVALSATTGADLGYGEHIVFERVSIRPQQGPPVRATAMTGSRLDLVP